MSDPTLPNLRFPAFSENWEKKKFDSFCIKISSGKSKTLEQGKYSVHGSTGLLGYTDDFSHDAANILVARVGANAGLLNCVEGKVGVTDNTLVIELIDQELQKFYYYLLESSNLNKYIFGTGQPLITGGILKGLNVQLPQSKTEKQKISNFLSAVDKKITLLKEKHALLEQYKKGVMQKLLSQEIRFKDENGNDFPVWQEERFSNILVLQLNSLKMNDESEYELITVRRRNGGVDSRGIYKGKDVLVKNQFALKANQFVISKRQIVHGACGLVPEELAGAIVSNEYNVFDPVPEKLDINYFNMIATSLTMRRAFFINSDGVHIEKLLFKTQSWLKTNLDFPCVEEQRKIVSFIESLDKKLNLVSQQIEQTQAFKKGLLQQMFV
jgi:type I restriction enzyme S subunit